MFGSLFRRSGPISDQVNTLGALLGAAEEHREILESLKAERATLAAAPRPIAEAIAALDVAMAGLAEEAVDGLRVERLTQRGARSELRLTETGDPRLGVERLFGLLAVAAGPALRAALVTQLEDYTAANPAPPMADGELRDRLAEIDAEILRVELAEEAAIRRLEGMGAGPSRRPDADVRAVLASDAACKAA